MQADTAARRAEMMMDMSMKKMGKQMLDFYKTSFDNSVSAMLMLQEQMEHMGNTYWGQMANLPEEAKKGIAEVTKSHKKHCEDFKKAVDDGFKKLDSFLVEAEKTAEKAAEKAKT